MCSLIVIIIVCNYNTISLGGERTTFPWTIFPGEILSINLGNVIRPLFLKNMDFPYGKFCLTKKEKLIYKREKISALCITFPFFKISPFLAILIPFLCVCFVEP